MLSQSTINAVRRLLDEDDLTQREIARYVGVSRGTVQAIGDGSLVPKQAYAHCIFGCGAVGAQGRTVSRAAG